jgi:hypothetical protein
MHNGVYLRNIPVTYRKELRMTVDKACAESFNLLLEKVTNEENWKLTEFRNAGVEYV